LGVSNYYSSFSTEWTFYNGMPLSTHHEP
jgi:hypothetical protein